jgi:hypothetical protein
MCGISGKSDPAITIIPRHRNPVGEFVLMQNRALGNPKIRRAKRLCERLGLLLQVCERRNIPRVLVRRSL